MPGRCRIGDATNCGQGTVVNADGDSCEPSLSADVVFDAESGMIKPTAAALDAARQGGVDSVTPLSCDAGTIVNAAGDACEPVLSADVVLDAESGMIKPTAAALDAARQGGVDSVTPLNCAAGTQINAPRAMPVSQHPNTELQRSKKVV